MENFITGHAGAESQQRRALRRILGPEGYERFFERFLDVFFTDDDARFLASLGLNSLRIPFNYRHFEDDDSPYPARRISIGTATTPPSGRRSGHTGTSRTG